MGKQMVRVAMNTSNFLGQTGLCKSSIAQSRMCCIALLSASGNLSVQKVPIPQASALRSKKHFAKMRSLHPPDAEHKGFGHSPTSILNLIFRNRIQKSCRGTTAHCLPLLCPFVFDFSKPRGFKTSCEKRMLVIYYR